MTTRAQHGIFKPNRKYDDYALTSTTTPPISPLPRSHLSALKDPNWYKAMCEEYNAMVQTHTWDLVPRPPNANVIRARVTLLFSSTDEAPIQLISCCMLMISFSPAHLTLFARRLFLS
uniref:Uncharacterized protein n=1 Tax=Chenopodium quinoa TaxID=63459 RepID=A0A803L3Q2_CHEQI